MAKNTGLSDFKKVMKEYNLLIRGAIGNSTVPFVAAFASLTPAAPNNIAGVTAVIQLMVIALVFHLLRTARKIAISRVMIAGSVIVLLLLPIYIFSISQFIYSEPHSNLRFTRGYECTEEAIIVFSNKCPFLGTDDIAKANYDEDKIWTLTSTSLVKVFLVSLWLSLSTAISVLFSSFIIFQIGKTRR